MILDLEESQKLCDWLLQRGLGLKEVAFFLADIECGDTFCLALIKVFKNRRDMEKIHGKFTSSDWGNPITP